MREDLASSTVGDIVATDYRTAAVFERFGIDFCCGGRQPLLDACRAAAVDPDDVRHALDGLPAAQAGDEDASGWPLDRLIDHIVIRHHGYVRSALPAIAAYLVKLVDVHGARHPELMRVRFAFDAMRAGLEQHMLKEEQVLFPYVRELAADRTCGRRPSPFGTVEHPIRMMEREHEEAGAALRIMRGLTYGFTVPADGCTAYAVCMSELAAFEQDLHRHVHLENNVLFPRAIELEGAIAGANAGLAR